MRRVEEPKDGVLRLSATRINTYLECPRKYGWQYIAKLPRQEHASAALGSACHTQLERYLEHGTPLDFGLELGGRHPAKIIEPSLPFLPAPKTPGMQIEQYFRWTSPKGHLFIGYKDVRVDGSAREGVPLVIDHKTTSDIREWAKKREELPTDPQATIYAADELARTPDAPAVDLMWVYSQTKGPRRSEPVRLRVVRDDPIHLRAVEAIDLVASDILADSSSNIAPKDLEPNPRACDKYGGCPFKDHCNLTGRERIRSMANAGSKGSSDLMSRLAERAGDEAPVASTPTAAVDPKLAWLFAPKDPGPGTNLPVGYKAPEAAQTARTPSDAPNTASAGVTVTVPPASTRTPEQIAQRDLGTVTVTVQVPGLPPITSEDAAAMAALTSPFPPTDMPINPPEFQRAPTPEEMAAKDAADAAAKAKPAASGDGGAGRFRRTKVEIEAGLTVEQAKAARAAAMQAGRAVSTLADIAVQAGAITQADADRANADMREVLREIEDAQAIGQDGKVERFEAPAVRNVTGSATEFEKIAKVASDAAAKAAKAGATAVEEHSRLSQEIQPESYFLPGGGRVPTREEVDAFTPQFVKDVVAGVLKKAEADGVIEKVERFEAPVTRTRTPYLERTQGFTLFVDCLPIGGDVTPASDVIAEVHAEIKKDLGVLDYRLVDYGKGAGMLSFGVADVAKARGVDLYLDTRTPEGMCVKEALAGVAARVVQGVR